MAQKILHKPWFWYVTALVVIFLDQASKHAILAYFYEGEVLSLTSFFDFTLRYNPGAAFSFLANAGGWQRWFFGAIAITASVLLSIWIYRASAQKPLEAFALSFILGGALGNLYDRIFLGHVVDFIQVHYQNTYYFPAFNLADSAIFLGAVILIVDMFFGKEKKSDA
jgi:signal peptidase II